MRIAYLCADPGVPVFGRKGASVHVQAVVAALARRGAEVHLLAARQGGEPPGALRDVALHRLPCPRGEPAARERAALAANAASSAALEAAGPFDLVYERHALWSHAAMEHARASGTPGLLEVNAPLVDEQAAHRVLVDREGAERIARRAFAAASALLAVSQPVADWLRAYGVPAGRVHVVPNGVDPNRFAPPPPRPRDAPFTVGFVGTLKPWHGLEALVDAFELVRREHPRARLLVVGDGPGRPALEAALVARGLSADTRMTGAVDPAAVPALLREMDTAVAPYPDLRPFYFSPLKVVEYMAAGLPVVASRVGQVTQTVEHGVTGLLVPPGDTAALAGALGRLAGDPGLRCRLGRAARERAAQRYSWDRVAERILALARERRAVAA